MGVSERELMQMGEAHGRGRRRKDWKKDIGLNEKEISEKNYLKKQERLRKARKEKWRKEGKNKDGGSVRSDRAVGNNVTVIPQHTAFTAPTLFNFLRWGLLSLLLWSQIRSSLSPQTDYPLWNESSFSLKSKILLVISVFYLISSLYPSWITNSCWDGQK
jgi:hypothetical protein